MTQTFKPDIRISKIDAFIAEFVKEPSMWATEAHKDWLRTELEKLITEVQGETEQYAKDWVKAMWDMDCISHEEWDDGLEEAQASIQSYMEGLHIKYPPKS